jgi:hypothetical protein
MFDTFVRLTNIVIGNDLELDGAVFVPSATPIRPPQDHAARPGDIILAGAQVGVLKSDFTESRTPRNGKGQPTSYPAVVVTTGASYTSLESLQPPKARLKWLKAGISGQPSPQPFEVLAATYRNVGRDEYARKVLHARRRFQTKTSRGIGSIPIKIGGALLDILSGYGYRPLRAFGWLIIGIIVGFGLFTAHPPAGIHGAPQRLLYTIDVIIPTSPFGLEANQPADSIGFWTATALKALGWALSLALLPAISRSLSRD